MTERDEVGRHLTALSAALARELEHVAEVTRDDHPAWGTGSTWIEPRRPDALRVVWTEYLPEHGEGQLQVEAGHHGGRWELGASAADAEFLEDLTRAVIAGRAVETFGPGRSRVEVTLASGEVVSETGYVSPKGCLPLPGWLRRGRRVAYAPYAE